MTTPDDELTLDLDGENLTISFDNDLKPTDEVVDDTEGQYCVGCGEFYEYATVNQPNGTFKCWGCRH